MTELTLKEALDRLRNNTTWFGTSRECVEAVVVALEGVASIYDYLANLVADIPGARTDADGLKGWLESIGIGTLLERDIKPKFPVGPYWGKK